MTEPGTGFTNIGGIKFQTKYVDFENTKDGPEIVTVALKDGTVFTFSKTLQKAHVEKTMKQKNRTVAPFVTITEGGTKYGVDLAKYTSMFDCCFSSVKGAREATTYELANSKINTLDIKNGQNDIVDGGTIKNLIRDDNDKMYY